ncbi:hypothetical protein C8R46DRAFT_1215472 [Mycena filopes]|nr:hypothetical protein C8R46DRAFT_1215472 [Mycena filopes]
MTKATKKTRKKISKQYRRNLRLWAEGVREEVLKPHLESYADALDRNWRAERDALQAICNEFYERIGWRLADHEEPELPLPPYDPKKVPEKETLDDDEEDKKRARLALLKQRIRRWLKYRVRRLRKQLHSRLDVDNDPWAVLVGKLAGIKSPPKARQGYQQYMHEEYAGTIAPVVAERWAANAVDANSVQTKKTPDASFRALVAREMFKALPDAEQAAYGTRAKAEAKARREEYKAIMEKDPSRTPEARQKCINNLGSFLSPILLGIQEYTGLQSTVILGGPLPRYGELRAIYVAIGRNRAVNPQHFPAWGGARFEAGVLGLMKEYLDTAFTAQDVEESRLPEPVLAGAKYTIDPHDDSDDSDKGGSTSSDTSDHSDNSNDDSDDSTAAPKPAKKKKKAAPKPKAKPAVPSEKGKVRAPPKTAVKKKGGAAAKKAVAPDSDSEDDAATGAHPAAPAAKKKGGAAAKKAVAPDSGSEDDAAKTGAKRPRAEPSTKPRKSRRLGGREESDMDVDPPTNAGTIAPEDVTTTTPTEPATPLPTPPATQHSVPAADVEIAPVIPIVFPDNAPLWLTDAIAWLMQNELGPHYRALVNTLIELERRYDFVGGTTLLPKVHRPIPVNLWITGARGARLKFPPTISNHVAYAAQWNQWWDTLQPAWRVRGVDGFWKVGREWGANDGWGKLEAPGANGCLSLVAALYIWGVYNRNDGPDVVEMWVRAVQDVTWMLEGLVASLPEGKKTGAGKKKKNS